MKVQNGETYKTITFSQFLFNEKMMKYFMDEWTWGKLLFDSTHYGSCYPYLIMQQLFSRYRIIVWEMIMFIIWIKFAFQNSINLTETLIECIITKY